MQKVRLPDKNITLHFPEGTTQEEMKTAIDNHIYYTGPLQEKMKESASEVSKQWTSRFMGAGTPSPVSAPVEEEPQPQRGAGINYAVPYHERPDVQEQPLSEAEDIIMTQIGKTVGLPLEREQEKVEPSSKPAKMLAGAWGNIPSLMAFYTPAGMASATLTKGLGLTGIAGQAARGAMTGALGESLSQLAKRDYDPKDVATSAAVLAVADPVLSQAVKFISTKVRPQILRMMGKTKVSPTEVVIPKGSVPINMEAYPKDKMRSFMVEMSRGREDLARQFLSKNDADLLVNLYKTSSAFKQRVAQMARGGYKGNVSVPMEDFVKATENIKPAAPRTVGATGELPSRGFERTVAATSRLRPTEQIYPRPMESAPNLDAAALGHSPTWPSEQPLPVQPELPNRETLNKLEKELVKKRKKVQSVRKQGKQPSAKLQNEVKAYEKAVDMYKQDLDRETPSEIRDVFPAGRIKSQGEMLPTESFSTAEPAVPIAPIEGEALTPATAFTEAQRVAADPTRLPSAAPMEEPDMDPWEVVLEQRKRQHIQDAKDARLELGEAQENQVLTRPNLTKKIRELGGINYQKSKAAWGDSETKQVMARTGPGIFRKKGLPADVMLAELQDMGIPLRDINDLWERLATIDTATEEAIIRETAKDLNIAEVPEVVQDSVVAQATPDTEPPTQIPTGGKKTWKLIPGDASPVDIDSMTQAFTTGASLIKNASKYFSVRQPFNNIGANDTGLALENAYTTSEYEAGSVGEPYVKFINDQQTKHKLTESEVLEVTLSASNERRMQKHPPELQKRIRKSVDETRKVLQDVLAKEKKAGVLEKGFIERLKTELQDSLASNTEAYKKARKPHTKKRYLDAMRADQATLKFITDNPEIHYMPIPYQYWFGNKVRGEGSMRFKSVLSQYWTKRKTVDFEGLVNHLLEEGTITPQQVDPRRVMATYLVNHGKKMAMANIKNAAVKDGLALRPADAPEDWNMFPPNIAPGFDGMKLHPALHEYIENNLMIKGTNIFDPAAKEVVSGIRKFWSGLKMFQFENPIILPAYDILQGVVGGAARNWKYPAYLAKGARSVAKKDDLYWAMFEHGAFPRPWSLSQGEFLNRIEMMIENRTLPGAIISEIKRLGNLREGAAINEIYRLSHSLAWKMDNMVRSATVQYLLDKGYPMEEAAKLTAQIHGNYASIPPSTRRTLNVPLFTPSFWIAMAKEQGKMVAALPKIAYNKYKGDKRPGTERKTDMKYAEMLLAAVALNAGFDLMMRKQGFKSEQPLRKYTMEVPDGKQVVVTVAQPYNILFRWTGRLSEIPETEGTLNKMLKLSPVSIHPGWRIFFNLVANSQGGPDRIVNKFETTPTQIKEAANYIISEAIPMTERIRGTEPAKFRQEAIDALHNELGKFAYVLDALAFVYQRSGEARQTQYRIRNLQSELKTLLRNKDATPEEMERWINNYGKKVKEEADRLNQKDSKSAIEKMIDGFKGTL